MNLDLTSSPNIWILCTGPDFAASAGRTTEGMWKCEELFEVGVTDALFSELCHGREGDGPLSSGGIASFLRCVVVAAEAKSRVWLVLGLCCRHRVDLLAIWAVARD